MKGVRPPVLEVWPLWKGTKLTKGEILRLEQGGFQLEQRRAISPRRLFGSSTDHAANAAAIPTPSSPNQYPSLRDGRRIRRLSEGKVLVKQRNR